MSPTTTADLETYESPSWRLNGPGLTVFYSPFDDDGFLKLF